MKHEKPTWEDRAIFWTTVALAALAVILVKVGIL